MTGINLRYLSERTKLFRALILLFTLNISSLNCIELEEFKKDYQDGGKQSSIKWDKPSLSKSVYEILFDYEFTPPIKEAQMIRHILWFRYMELSPEQLRILSGCARDIQKMKDELQKSLETIIERGVEKLSPLYKEILELIQHDADDRILYDKIMKVGMSKVELQMTKDYQKKKISTLKSMLNRVKDFLITLSPEQEKKLVSSLFFLRRELDPLTNPGEYEDIVGQVWSPGDYSILSRLEKEEKMMKEMNIGNLWGIDEEALNSDMGKDYSNIKRKVIAFMIVKDPLIIESIKIATGTD